jgi:hypothetical protein
MQIITLEDSDFPVLLTELRSGKPIGRYVRENGKALVVYATRNFMLVSAECSPSKIGLRPARSLHESEELAREYLKREQERGSWVEFSDELRQHN